MRETFADKRFVAPPRCAPDVDIPDAGQPIRIQPRLAPRIEGVTRPGIVAWMRNHIRPYRIEFDIAHQLQKILLAVYHGRPVTPLPQGTAALVSEVEILHILAPYRLKDFTDAVLLRWCSQ